MQEKNLVIFGGKSVEHDISIITAVQAMKSLPKECDFVPVYMDKNGIWWTGENFDDIKTFKNFQKNVKNAKQVTLILGEKMLMVKKRNKFVPLCNVKSVLNCCHGNIGEDGSVQGVFKCCNIPHTSCSVTSSALSMDKAFFKDILVANGVDTAPYVVLKQRQNGAKTAKKLGFPVVVKPANLGSSIGISVCKNEKELENALELAFSFDKKVVVEKMVQNLQEFNCAAFVYKGEMFVSQVNEVKMSNKIYTFDEKYLSKEPKNGKADKTISKKIVALTKKVYELLDCAGVVRVDFLFDSKEKQLFVNEINTIPGSLACYLFKDYAFSEILSAMIKQAEDDICQEQKLTKTFESSAIEVFEKSAPQSKK